MPSLKKIPEGPMKSFLVIISKHFSAMKVLTPTICHSQLFSNYLHFCNSHQALQTVNLHKDRIYCSIPIMKSPNIKIFSCFEECMFFKIQPLPLSDCLSQLFGNHSTSLLRIFCFLFGLSETYREPCQTTTMELFCEDN